MKVVESLNAGLRGAMREREDVYFLGEDLLDPYGGAFKVASGASTEFPERVLTTPVSEAGIVGLGIGMALRGLRPVVEVMFGDFLALAADQLINSAAKLRWMSADKVRVPLVVRTPMGGGRGYGPTHSQSLEKLFLGVPGLRVVAVSDCGDPGAVLRAAILDDDDPVLFVEHKLLYAVSVREPVLETEFDVETSNRRYPTYRYSLAGSPAPGLTIAAYGYMASLARRAQIRLAYEHEVFAELLIFTELSPSPISPLLESVERTGRLLTVEEGSRNLGWGAEVVARTAETTSRRLAFHRLAARDLPIPAARPLEAAVLPAEQQIVDAALRMVAPALA